jgi:hypothetical protein
MAYGIIYGHEGADYPDVVESGPYDTLKAAKAAVRRDLSARYRGWTIVAEWEPSDRESIASGSGIVVISGD